MKVLLYTEGLKKVGKSGLGKAVQHQINALEENHIEYSLDPKYLNSAYCLTAVVENWIVLTKMEKMTQNCLKKQKKWEKRLYTMHILPKKIL